MPPVYVPVRKLLRDPHAWKGLWEADMGRLLFAFRGASSLPFDWQQLPLGQAQWYQDGQGETVWAFSFDCWGGCPAQLPATASGLPGAALCIRSLWDRVSVLPSHAKSPSLSR